MINIYKITKETDPMAIYIGKTTQTIKERFASHKILSKNRTSKFYHWFDNNCIIELIEVCNYDDDAKIREMEIVQEYISNGYNVMNTKIGVYTLDPATYVKSMNEKFRPKHNANRHPEYNKWTDKICRKAKKEGLTSKEYKLKYSIPDYTGPKTKN